MQRALCSILIASAAVLTCTWALSQTTKPTTAGTLAASTPSVSDRPDPAIERIRTEDAGSRVDELRVGGETQSIIVQPKSGGKVPYEVKPAESARGNPPSASNGDTNGSRVWNLLKF